MPPHDRNIDRSPGRLPDFIGIGAMKTGSTSLDFYLGLHPEIHVAKPKEPNFFVDADAPRGNWNQGEAWYRRLFANNKRLCGETSPRYTQAPSFPGVAGRMAKLVPDAKLIYLVREPMTRLRSHYFMMLKRGIFEGSFTDFVEQQQPAVDASCYGRQVEEYLRHFPLERILVVESEELFLDRRAVLRRVFRFLGASESFFSPLFFHRRLVGKTEPFPSPLGRRLLTSTPMRFAERTLPPGIYYHLRNLVSAPFALPAPSTDLPDTKERELAELFRSQVALLRQLTGLPLPSLGPVKTMAR